MSDTYTVELHLPGLIGTAEIFFNRLHWQFEVRLLLFTVYTCV